MTGFCHADVCTKPDTANFDGPTPLEGFTVQQGGEPDADQDAGKDLDTKPSVSVLCAAAGKTLSPIGLAPNSSSCAVRLETGCERSRTPTSLRKTFSIPNPAECATGPVPFVFSFAYAFYNGEPGTVNPPPDDSGVYVDRARFAVTYAGRLDRSFSLESFNDGIGAPGWKTRSYGFATDAPTINVTLSVSISNDDYNFDYSCFDDSFVFIDDITLARVPDFVPPPADPEPSAHSPCIVAMVWRLCAFFAHIA
jgi:hypothetical protein